MNRIFISYGREDVEIASRIYQELNQAGYSPWIDKEDLVGGQEWKVAIRKAILESSAVLVLLSSESAERRGYLQKEIRTALDTLQEFPENQVFLIPVRIDNCRPSHSRLEEIQWVDLFPSFEDGFERILDALRMSSGWQTMADRKADLPGPATEQSSPEDIGLQASDSPPKLVCDLCKEEVIFGALRCKHCHADIRYTSAQMEFLSNSPPVFFLLAIVSTVFLLNLVEGTLFDHAPIAMLLAGALVILISFLFNREKKPRFRKSEIGQNR